MPVKADPARQETRRARALLPLFAAAAALLAAPAPAQIAAGYSGIPGVRRLPQSDLWFAIRQLGHCLARRTELARELLTTPMGSAEESRAIDGLMGRETSCLLNASRIRFTNIHLRGAIAEALYEREFRGPPPVDQAALDDPEQGRRLGFAGCFAARRPDAIHRLLARSRLGDNSEHEILTELAPELAQCLPAGERVELDAPFTRMLLAEALYMRARGQQPGR